MMVKIVDDNGVNVDDGMGEGRHMMVMFWRGPCMKGLWKRQGRERGLINAMRKSSNI